MLSKLYYLHVLCVQCAWNHYASLLVYFIVVEHLQLSELNFIILHICDRVSIHTSIYITRITCFGFFKLLSSLGGIDMERFLTTLQFAAAKKCTYFQNQQWKRAWTKVPESSSSCLWIAQKVPHRGGNYIIVVEELISW